MRWIESIKRCVKDACNDHWGLGEGWFTLLLLFLGVLVIDLLLLLPICFVTHHHKPSLLFLSSYMETTLITTCADESPSYLAKFLPINLVLMMWEREREATCVISCVFILFDIIILYVKCSFYPFIVAVSRSKSSSSSTLWCWIMARFRIFILARTLSHLLFIHKPTLSKPLTHFSYFIIYPHPYHIHPSLSPFLAFNITQFYCI